MLRERFEKVYRLNEWGYGSGSGSLPRHNVGYAKFLQEFIDEHDIRTVLDLGCGDWQFSRYIDWSAVRYVGMDLVRPVIDRNTELFSATNIEFRHFSGDMSELPEADLLISKDVLQHLSNGTIQSILPTLQRYRFNLITNCVNPRGETENVDIEDGKMRYLDIRLPPFSSEAREVFSFTDYRPHLLRYLKKIRWRKCVLLLENKTLVRRG
jgi:SAM-dependent methyltransferase